MRPHRRPPWWPEGEPFPPRGFRRGPWRGGRRLMWRIGIFVIFMWLLGGALVSALASLISPGGQRGHFGALLAASLILGALLAMGISLRVVRGFARRYNRMSARLAEQDAQRRSVLADLAHELRTPLSVIRGQAEGIADGLYPGDAAHVEPILEATHTLERLVEDLRTLVLSDAGSLTLDYEQVDLVELINETIEAFNSAARNGEVALEREVEELPSIEADPVRIRSVIGNLVANAIRHTPPGGSVSVAAARSSTGIDVTVRDTGAGIPEALLPRVFDRFVKGEGSTGSGLGLAIAKDLVQAHGGSIAIESKTGAGTTVRFSLPLQPATGAQSGA